MVVAGVVVAVVGSNHGEVNHCNVEVPPIGQLGHLSKGHTSLGAFAEPPTEPVVGNIVEAFQQPRLDPDGQN